MKNLKASKRKRGSAAGSTALLGKWFSLSLPDQAMRVLSQAGYTQIEITGWRPLMAGKDDTFSTGFRAKSPSGAIVTGAVTSGPLSGSTVRLDCGATGPERNADAARTKFTGDWRFTPPACVSPGGWESWSKVQIADELRRRMNHFYRQTDGTMRFPQNAEGDLLKMVALLML